METLASVAHVRKRVVCGTCPRGCPLGEGEQGVCGAVENLDGVLVNARLGAAFRLRMGRRSSPFSRFLPGEHFLTIESRGSGLKPAVTTPIDIWWEGPDSAPRLTADEAVFLGRAWGCKGVFLETDDPYFAAGTGEQILRRARDYSLRTAVATSGYLCAGARRTLLELVDAVELLFYGVSPGVYHRLFAVRPEPVFETVAALAGRSCPTVEVVVPLIPGENDSTAEVGKLARFLLERLGPGIPVAFAAEDPALPDERLASACAEALGAGLSDIHSLARAEPT